MSNGLITIGERGVAEHGRVSWVIRDVKTDRDDPLSDYIYMTSDFYEPNVEELIKYLKGKALLVGMITSLRVAPEVQREGLGSKLMRGALESMSHTDVCIVFADLSAPQIRDCNLLRFYQGFGFKRVSQSGDEVLMARGVKDLDQLLIDHAADPNNNSKCGGTE